VDVGKYLVAFLIKGKQHSLNDQYIFSGICDSKILKALCLYQTLISVNNRSITFLCLPMPIEKQRSYPEAG
jgi:hypothetical protein